MLVLPSESMESMSICLSRCISFTSKAWNLCPKVYQDEFVSPSESMKSMSICLSRQISFTIHIKMSLFHLQRAWNLCPYVYQDKLVLLSESMESMSICLSRWVSLTVKEHGIYVHMFIKMSKSYRQRAWNLCPYVYQDVLVLPSDSMESMSICLSRWVSFTFREHGIYVHMFIKS